MTLLVAMFVRYSSLLSCLLLSRLMKPVILAISACFTLMASPEVAHAQRNEPKSAEQPTGRIGVYIEHTAPNYPVVRSVEPGSPAEKGGLVAGDTILAYNRADPRTDSLALRRLLQPGRHIRLRLRHNGERTAEVVVGKVPQMSIPGLVGDQYGMVTLGTQAALIPIQETIDGLRLVSLNADLADVLHMRNEGVLVLDVSPGTPAMRAGLKGGDVILMVDTIRVNTSAVFIKALFDEQQGQGGDRRVTMDVIRRGKTRKVTIRW